MSYLFDPDPPFSLSVAGTDSLYPVRRIFCVGRNYAAHAREMGHEPDREAPFYFTKSPFHGARSGATLPYPNGTANYHHEMELAMVLGTDGILGYAGALDMTRRDRQQDGKDSRRPWDLGKDVEGSAVIGEITRAEDFGEIAGQTIWLDVNGERRQEARLDELIHSVPEVIADLSGYYRLGAGDVILTGTPAGVGPVVAGDKIVGGIDGLSDVRLTLT